MRLKEGQLVNEHFERIDRDLLKKHPSIVKSHIEGKQGIYALYRKGRLQYVGIAANLASRLNKHLKDHHAQTWDSFSAYLITNHFYKHELESLIIRISPPKGNKISGKFVNSENLTPLLKKEFMKEFNEKLYKYGLKKQRVIAKPKIKTKSENRLVLAPYVKNRFKIRYKYKGVIHKATVRKDGTINYNGKFYDSPSGAAKAVAKHHVDGWNVWKYQNTSGDWVLLDTLRRK